MITASIKPEYFLAFLNAIAPVVCDCRLRGSPDGISVRAVDPANVAMVITKIPVAGFETYIATDDEIGLDVVALRNTLKPMLEVDRPQSLQISKKDGEEALRFTTTSCRMVVKTLDLHNIQKEPSEKSVDGISPLMKTTVTIHGGETLAAAIKAIASVSAKVTLGVWPSGRFFIEAEEDTSSLSMDWDLSCGPEAKTSFSLDYLKDFTGPLREASGERPIEIHLGTDVPMWIHFAIAGGHGAVDYLLAPRIEE